MLTACAVTAHDHPVNTHRSRRLVTSLSFLLLLTASLLIPRWSVADEQSTDAPLSGEPTAAEPSTEPVDAAPVQMLEQFIATLDSFEATFEQTLYDADSEPLRESSGSIKLKRPARFVWIYDAPESQQIVGDGESIWLYDEDLEQVTVNAIDERIDGTPLQLLMRAAPLSEGFDIESRGQSDGIDWFALSPLTQASDFEQVFIGLQNDALAVMELRDSFGQATQIRFTNFNKGIALDDALFVFDVPEGVDVIGLDE